MKQDYDLITIPDAKTSPGWGQVAMGILCAVAFVILAVALWQASLGVAIGFAAFGVGGGTMLACRGAAAIIAARGYAAGQLLQADLKARRELLEDWQRSRLPQGRNDGP